MFICIFLSDFTGEIPGNAFAFNQHGVITTCDAVYPVTVVHGKIGKIKLPMYYLANICLMPRSHRTAVGKGAPLSTNLHTPP